MEVIKEIFIYQERKKKPLPDSTAEAFPVSILDCFFSPTLEFGSFETFKFPP